MLYTKTTAIQESIPDIVIADELGTTRTHLDYMIDTLFYLNSLEPGSDYRNKFHDAFSVGLPRGFSLDYGLHSGTYALVHRKFGTIAQGKSDEIVLGHLKNTPKPTMTATEYAQLISQNMGFGSNFHKAVASGIDYNVFAGPGLTKPEQIHVFPKETTAEKKITGRDHKEVAKEIAARYYNAIPNDIEIKTEVMNSLMRDVAYDKLYNRVMDNKDLYLDLISGKTEVEIRTQIKDIADELSVTVSESIFSEEAVENFLNWAMNSEKDELDIPDID